MSFYILFHFLKKRGVLMIKIGAQKAHFPEWENPPLDENDDHHKNRYQK